MKTYTLKTAFYSYVQCRCLAACLTDLHCHRFIGTAADQTVRPGVKKLRVSRGHRCLAQALPAVIPQPPPPGTQLCTHHTASQLCMEEKTSRKFPSPGQPDLTHFNLYLITICIKPHFPSRVYQPLGEKKMWVKLFAIDSISFPTWFCHCFMTIEANNNSKSKIPSDSLIHSFKWAYDS